MWYDVKCPNCGDLQNIDHDDGYGFEEDELHEQYCLNCGYVFKYETIVTYSYQVFCADGDHKLEQSQVVGCENLWNCIKCDYSKIVE